MKSLATSFSAPPRLCVRILVGFVKMRLFAKWYYRMIPGFAGPATAGLFYFPGSPVAPQPARMRASSTPRCCS